MANGVYAAKEQKYVEKFHSFKAVIFKPLLYILTSLGIKANHVSFFSFLTALATLAYSFYTFDPIYFIVGIWVHIFLDSLDGPLARYQKSASSLGSFIDVICDHIGILASGFYLLSFTSISPSAVLLFITLYTIDIYNLFIANICKNPISIVFRPRMFVYFFIALDFILLTNHTNNLVIFLNVILIIQTILSLTKIKNIVQKVDN